MRKLKELVMMLVHVFLNLHMIVIAALVNVMRIFSGTVIDNS